MVCYNIKNIILPLGTFGPIFGGPMQGFGVDFQGSFSQFFFVFGNQIFVQGQNVLAFVIIDEIQLLQSRNNILFFD